MSRIEDLVSEHCQNGVPFTMLGQLGRRNAGIPITAGRMRTLHRDGGSVRVFAAGDTFADVAMSEIEVRSVISDPSIIVKSRGNVGFAYYEHPFTHKNEMWSYTLTDPRVNQKFIYYYLLTRVHGLQNWARATSVKLPQLAVGDTDRLRVPVPPLEVQREIVRILDHFTELEAELEAELDARRGQYAYYRSALLSFEGSPLPIRSVPIGELGTWVGGITPSKGEPRYWDRGTIPWVASMDISACRGSVIRGRVTQAALDETTLRLVPAPSVAVVMRSNVLRRLLPIGFIEAEATVNQDLRVLRTHEGIDVRFAYQMLLASSEEIRKKCVRTDGSMAAVDSAAFFNWPVPVPPLDEQRRIVSILDKFDALVNDLSIGLPAELAARRRQYEYYRDRLLTFEEKVS